MRDRRRYVVDDVKMAAAIGVEKAINEPLKPDFENTPESEMCLCEPQNPDHIEFFKGGDYAPCLFERYNGFRP